MNRRLVAITMAVTLVPAAWLPAADKSAKDAQIVDGGSYGVYVSGKRVATETFQIEQRPDGSIMRSEFKVEEGSSAAAQTAVLHLSSNGDLVRYEWNEVSPGKSQAVLEVSDQFLIEHITLGEQEKRELPFFLPASTSVLDDNFFSHRQLLLWRYIGSSCVPRPEGGEGCSLAKTQFGAFVPQQHRPLMVSLEYLGADKVKIRGSERELQRFKLESEGIEWSLWLDSMDKHRLVRVLIAGQNIEVLRD